jgi:hypothetical protein
MIDDYKQKYEELMQRCEEFNIWFEEHKKKMGIRIIPTQPFGPAKTMDIMWPDRMPTTTPWPPIGIQYTYNSVCKLCRIDLNKATHYVCHHPTCPTQIKVTC